MSKIDKETEKKLEGVAIPNIVVEQITFSALSIGSLFTYRSMEHRKISHTKAIPLGRATSIYIDRATIVIAIFNVTSKTVEEDLSAIIDKHTRGESLNTEDTNFLIRLSEYIPKAGSIISTDELIRLCKEKVTLSDSSTKTSAISNKQEPIKLRLCDKVIEAIELDIDSKEDIALPASGSPSPSPSKDLEINKLLTKLLSKEEGTKI